MVASLVLNPTGGVSGGVPEENVHDWFAVGPSRSGRAGALAPVALKNGRVTAKRSWPGGGLMPKRHVRQQAPWSARPDDLPTR